MLKANVCPVRWPGEMEMDLLGKALLIQLDLPAQQADQCVSLDAEGNIGGNDGIVLRQGGVKPFEPGHLRRGACATVFQKSVHYPYPHGYRLWANSFCFHEDRSGIGSRRRTACHITATPQRLHLPSPDLDPFAQWPAGIIGAG